jgi:3-deoxy-7-phosphoheptulonate synthase
MMKNWTSSDWRSHVPLQLPQYEDKQELARVELELSQKKALVAPYKIRNLTEQLARVGEGSASLLQIGECAESFLSAPKTQTETLTQLIRSLRLCLSDASSELVVTARIAGQYAKPRSDMSETMNGVTLPSYRGDMINGHSFEAEQRKPDPARLISAYNHAENILKLLPSDIYTCHEALHLNFEEALTRFDMENHDHYATSAHFLWLGARTFHSDSAQVSYLSGVQNPLGLKLAPHTDITQLNKILDILNPDNKMGRITLIPRLGHQRVETALPQFIETIQSEGRNVVWCCDPMHGNTFKTENGLKTRYLEHIMNEASLYFAVHKSYGTFGGGLHLEASGEIVTECIGYPAPLELHELSQNYKSLCDPRLNAEQAKLLMQSCAPYFSDYAVAA